MFFGLEFPVSDSYIENSVAHITYFSSKTFEMFKSERRLETGFFKTWPIVCGAARSTEYEIVRADFLTYLDTIRLPTKMRT